MEFLVEFEAHVPEGTPATEVERREDAESTAAASLAAEGHLVRLWRLADANEGRRTVGLYRAETVDELRRLLDGLPLAEWVDVTIAQLDPHPDDPVAGQEASTSRAAS